MSDTFKNTGDTGKEVEPEKEKRPYYRIQKEALFDIEENLMMSILHNMKRADALDNARHFCDSIGYPDVPEARLIQLYNNARDKLFEYRIEDIKAEKEKVIKRLYRLGAKSEAKNDFKSAKDCYTEVAKLAGVYNEVDESKVILNFVPVKPKKAIAEEILEAEFEEKKEERKNDKS